MSPRRKVAPMVHKSNTLPRMNSGAAPSTSPQGSPKASPRHLRQASLGQQKHSSSNPSLGLNKEVLLFMYDAGFRRYSPAYWETAFI